MTSIGKPGFVGKPSESGFHVMAKPCGPACNLSCEYCYYREKQAMFPAGRRKRMSDETLEAYIRNLVESTPLDLPVKFAWQGGEPTLLGLGFYRKAIDLQKRYADGRLVENSLQTNGTLLNNEWAEFFAENRFLIGLSLDGPASIHDRYRLTRAGKPTFRLVMESLRLLQRHDVDTNILACVNRHSSKYPVKIYRFFKSHHIDFIQFIPVIERPASPRYAGMGFLLEGPPDTLPQCASDLSDYVTPWSVLPLDWGKFLVAIFEEWRTQDVGSVFVMNFEWSLAALMNRPGGICTNQETCGRAIMAEHNGDVFACDHYAYPQFKLGNFKRDSLASLVDSRCQQEFGRAKSATLPNQCRTCKYVGGCWGGCPKHRFLTTADGQAPLQYLCQGNAYYLDKTLPYVQVMSELIRRGRNPAEIMGISSLSCLRYKN